MRTEEDLMRTEEDLMRTDEDLMRMALRAGTVGLCAGNGWLNDRLGEAFVKLNRSCKPASTDCLSFTTVSELLVYGRWGNLTSCTSFPAGCSIVEKQLTQNWHGL